MLTINMLSYDVTYMVALHHKYAVFTCNNCIYLHLAFVHLYVNNVVGAQHNNYIPTTN